MADAQLVFANCDYCNEDDSEVIVQLFVFISMYFYCRLVNWDIE